MRTQFRSMAVRAGVVLAGAWIVGGAFAPAAQAASWQDVDGACHNGGVTDVSDYLWCWDKKKRVNDSTPNYDVFAFKMSLSGQALRGELNRLWVEMDPRSTSPTQSWYSTDPRKPNQTYTTNTSCKDWHWEIGVSEGLTAAYGESGTICSNKVVYEPKTNAEQGHHAGVFWKSDCWDAGVSKRVTAAVLVKVAPSTVPLWDSSKHGMDVHSNGGGCTSY